MKESKFRPLRRDELEEVRDQFVKFLALNGMDAATWTRVKVEEPDRADDLILQFSQIVFQGVIEKVEFLIHRKPNDLRTYRTGPDKIEMRGLLLDQPCSVDLTRTDMTPEEMFERLKRERVSPKLYSAERAYARGGREQDLFLIMEGGALIDDGELFRVFGEVAG